MKTPFRAPIITLERCTNLSPNKILNLLKNSTDLD